MMKIQEDKGSKKLRRRSFGKRAGDILKRASDVLVSFFGLLLLSPLFGAIAIAIKRGSPGPVFYHGKRVGKNGCVFDILKFRTMYEKPESYAGPKVTGENDPRVTPMGKWLRDTKLNELPQLWNVLKGEMSLVGPRPEDPEIVSTWPEGVRREILSVRPGITSPASVLYRDEENRLPSEGVMESYLKVIAPDKQRLDQLYVRNRSFLLDMDVLLWTFIVLLPKIGQYQPPEHFLFAGPVSRFVRRYLNWFVIDSIVALIAVTISGLLWRSIAPLNIGWERAILAALGFTLLFSLSGSIFGVQRIEWSRARGIDTIGLVTPTILATLIAVLLNNLVFGSRKVPVGMVLLASGLSFLGFVFARYRSRLLRGFAMGFMSRTKSSKAARERIVIYGGGRAGEMAAYILRQIIGGNKAFDIVGFVDDDLHKQKVTIAGLPVLGNSRNLEQLVNQYDIGVLVFAIHNISQARKRKLIQQCAKLSIKVVILPDILQDFSIAIGANGKNHGRSLSADSLIAGWPGIAVGQVDEWLSFLETVLKRGDTETAMVQLKRFRERLAGIEKANDDSVLVKEKES